MAARHDAGMIRHTLLVVAAALAIAAAPPRPPAPLPDAVDVEVKTTLGTIVIAADVKHAPLTATHFVRLVDAHVFDGTSFYRAMVLDWGTPPNGLIQGGVQGNTQRVPRTVAHEPTTVTGLSHVAGAVSLARLAPGTGRGDFSIMLSDMKGLDADPARTDGDKDGYAVFGHVVSGMDVARRIFDSPRNLSKGAGAMKGQLLAAPVRIVTVRRLAADKSR